MISNIEKLASRYFVFAIMQQYKSLLILLHLDEYPNPKTLNKDKLHDRCIRNVFC